METLFLCLKKGLTAILFIVFAFVVTYIPVVPTTNVTTVEASGGGIGGIVHDPTQTVQSTLSAVADTLSWTKDGGLDMLAWGLAKATISGMVSSLIDWVNSDFQGRPAFVADLGGFLLDIADQEIGNVISDLGRVGSFICSPFRLDVQVAVAMQYAQFRGGDAEQSAPTCTLTGVIDNIQGFISGVDPGNGLADWLTITATPQTYTPYGAVLSAQATARARIINAQGEEIKLLEFGGGFLSQSVCQAIEGSSQQDCSIVTPGKIVQEALSFNLDSGRQSLVEADEINELIGALFSNLANKAITGAAGLLGLSGGNSSSYSDFNGSFLDGMIDEQYNQMGSPIEMITDTLRSERAYRNTAQAYLDELELFIIDPSNPEGEINLATILKQEISTEATKNEVSIDILTGYLTEYDSATRERRIQILVEYTKLNTTAAITQTRNTSEWQEQAALIGIVINIIDLSFLQPVATTTEATSTAATTTDTTE
jgi:hypothetical protein